MYKFCNDILGDADWVAIRWTPDGKRKRGGGKETWRRSVEREMTEQGWCWGQVTK